MKHTFRPKLFSILQEGYPKQQLLPDISAGVIVGIVALPLAIAFAIASGVAPEKGLITAIVAGFIISVFGGSRVQIGGLTGAFIVIVYGIVEQYGVAGLTIATFLAGFMLIVMGLARLGAVIQFIPHSLTVGFTSGIALIIFSSQIKDFLGLEMDTVPSEFLEKWRFYLSNLDSINPYATAIAIGTILITLYFSKITTKVPGSLVAIVLSTLVVQLAHLPVETIASRFGNIPSGIPAPTVPAIDFATVKNLIEPAFTIALLGAIESLLSAVVADGMIGGNHRSNQELVAQGTANIASSLFGGIPATGAIARTATNIKNGGRSPVAGIIHAITLLLIMLFVGKWAKLIPLSCLAGILVVVAYNMSEWRSFAAILKGPGADVLVLLATFLLTVLVDLTVAIEIGMVLAAFLFMRRMAQISNVKVITNQLLQEELDDPEATDKFIIPKGVEVYEVNGPLFFGAAHNFKESLNIIGKKSPQILIIRMRQVPIIDATGLHNLKEVLKRLASSGKTKIILSGIQADVYEEIIKTDIPSIIGDSNISANIQEALARAKDLLES
ncbi:MAG: STAS domain-containing protein [Saprospiraceae bacterium]|nr:STAS domain-containing protein [Saprospiraceae bacterium]